MRDSEQSQIEQARSREWRSLYRVLTWCLRRRGQDKLFGRCDYWILDDDWGGWQQTIHIYNMSLLTPSSVAELQSLLRQRYRQWHIWICLDGKRILRRSPEDKGIMVYPDRTEFYCDIDRLKRIFGGRMRWSTPWRG